MARPVLPTAGALNWQDVLNNGIYDVSDRADQAIAQAGSGMPGAAALDTFAGTSDDAKLSAAISYAAAQTYPPVIQLANRLHSFATQRVPYTGFRLRGQGRSNDAELGNPNQACEVHLSTNGPWLFVSGGSDAWNCEVSGISFTGTGSTTFLGCDGSTNWHGSLLRDVSFASFLSVLGTQAQKLLMTTSVIDGRFQMQGCTSGGIHIGGSDCYLFQNAIIDSAASNAPAGQFHMWFDGMDNTKIGRLYITAEAGWGGVRVTGTAYNTGVPSNLAMLSFDNGCVIEGRSASAPCWGSLLRVEGGNVRMRDAYIARAMSNPSAMGHSPADAGAVTVTGGALLLDGCIYDRYTGQAETVPFVYSTSNGPVQVLGTTVATKGGTWTGLPRVHNGGSGPFLTDSLVTAA